EPADRRRPRLDVLRRPLGEPRPAGRDQEVPGVRHV
ncbi:MAG: hypothetical protein AVDCRST_MAG64-3908, partial [uncultured Phycisphaerae bacterium]